MTTRSPWKVSWTPTVPVTVKSTRMLQARPQDLALVLLEVLQAALLEVQHLAPFLEVFPRRLVPHWVLRFLRKVKQSSQQPLRLPADLVSLLPLQQILLGS